MAETNRLSSGTRVLLALACFVILVAGMKAAGSILVPFLLSVFIAIICAPFMFWLQRKGLPNWLAILSILVIICVLTFFLAGFVGSSINSFIKTMPAYHAKLSEITGTAITWFEGFGFDVDGKLISDNLNPAKVMSIAGNMLGMLSGVFTNGFMILLTVVFILLEASGFPKKLQVAIKNPEQSMSGFSFFLESVNRYLGIKTIFSLITGTVIWLWLTVLGVDYALLWGLLAFLLNYVPNIGSIIAAVPAVLMALVQIGFGSALLAAGGYLVVNIVVGSVIEPKFMGKGLGLSTLIVFLSLVFWGWVLGPVGMLLSVPLTMIVKIALESSEDTQWFAILLGGVPSENVKSK
ncbi:MAG: AI-2E family transporter [Desulfobacterales bacterium]|nr:AI-2E family transporter [Desulfobacterales bacterium]